MNKLPNAKSNLSSILFACFSVLLICIVLYAFYGEEVRNKLEEGLFDIRTRLKPQLADTSFLALVTISQSDILSMEKEDNPYYRLLTIEKLIDKIFLAEPKAVAMVLPHHDYDYESKEFHSFIQILKKHENLYFGSFDLNFDIPTDTLVPEVFNEFPEQEFGTGTIRLYRRAVIRNLPLFSYRSEKLKMHLMNRMALDLSDSDAKARLENLNRRKLKKHFKELKNRSQWDESFVPVVRLNHIESDLFHSFSANEVLNNETNEMLTEKIVLIGYTAYRKRTFEFRDGTFVNSPWQGDGQAEIFGKPLIYVLANQLHNLLDGSWLRKASFKTNLLQTTIISLLSFFIWRLPALIAFSSIFILIAALLYLHGLLFSFYNLNIPLADTMLFSALATIAGAFVRGHINSKLWLGKLRKAEAKKKLASMQGRFLNRFSFDLYEYNKQIEDLIMSHEGSYKDQGLLEKIYKKALCSSRELGEYLLGIKQFASLRGVQAKKIRNENIKIKYLIEKIIKQFESLIEEGSIKLDINISEDLKVWSDELFLEPILFNLISNAIKYSPKSGTVKISASKKFASFTRIDIIDEGIGIAKENQEKIFEKFYRVKNDQVYILKGNGLGLFLCNYFAHKIGAKISLKSEIGCGSTFSLQIKRIV